MLYIMLLRSPTKDPKGNMARRVQWQYPEGLNVIAEYWLQTDNPNVIAICEADNIAPIMAVSTEWGDVFDITVVPAITAEEGIQLAQQMMEE